MFYDFIRQLSLLEVDFLQRLIRVNSRPEAGVLGHLDPVLAQDQGLELHVLCEGLAYDLDSLGNVGLQVFDGQVPYGAELVQLLQENLEIGRVICPAVRDVKRAESLVLHQDVLHDLALDLGDVDPSQFQDAQPAALV